jgi:hypothetical protein
VVLRNARQSAAARKAGTSRAGSGIGGGSGGSAQSGDQGYLLARDLLLVATNAVHRMKPPPQYIDDVIEELLWIRHIWGNIPVQNAITGAPAIATVSCPGWGPTLVNIE